MREFMMQHRLQYRNYSMKTYANYPNHSFPYVETPKVYYNSMGDYLLRGYDVWEWNERRGTGETYGSRLLADQGIFEAAMDNVIVAKDGFGGWGYSLVAGDGLIARLSPLTLSKTDFNGVRLDLSTPRLQATFMGSRIEKPIKIINPISVDQTAFIDPPRVTYNADASVMLLGGRLQSQLGGLRVGLNGANVHIFDSTLDGGNSLKGVVHREQLQLDYLLIRFTDDSPRDEQGGPTVQDVRIIIDGVVRTDIKPGVIRHQEGVETQVGTVSLRTGRFRSIIYYRPSGGGRNGQPAAEYYYNRNDIPRYADYLYRLQHEQGIDVGNITNLEGLLSVFQVESADEIQETAGTEQLVYIFDVSRERSMREVQIEALLANDYHVEAAMVRRFQPGAANLTQEFTSSFWRTMHRADGNVQDGSNLKRVRFRVGEDTGLYTYSADMHLALVGLEVQGEYARSALYARYPARLEDAPAYDNAPAFDRRGSAYYLNATRWFGGTRIGGEYFSINPEFKTTMRTYQPLTFLCCYEGLYEGMINETLYWDLVQDNEDGDNFPDRVTGEILGSSRSGASNDHNGVLIGQDENNDGIVDTDRNNGGGPDYNEPFLMFDVEPNTYVYGLDRNNNDEPDQREDDLDFDLPYDHGLRGFHLFASYDLKPNLSLATGRYDVEQVAGGGHNRSTYAMLTYRRAARDRATSLFFENHLRRVQDTVADEYMAAVETGRGNDVNRIRDDLLQYQDSYVNETYLDFRLELYSNFELVQKLRFRVNWQQGGEISPGLFQRKRRLDHWTVVSRAQYTWKWGRLRVNPQYKFMMLRLRDQEADQNLTGEYRSMPIILFSMPILKRTHLDAGLQGIGPWPYHIKNQTQSHLSEKRRTTFVSLSNRSKYFGYELLTIVSFQKDRRQLDDDFQKFREFDNIRFLVRSIIGFTRLSQPF